jgi:hypothetical protein
MVAIARSREIDKVYMCRTYEYTPKTSDERISDHCG